MGAFQRLDGYPSGTTEMFRKRLDHGVLDGQLEDGTDTATLARYLAALIVGMSVAAQDGASRDDLRSFSLFVASALEERRVDREAAFAITEDGDTARVPKEFTEPGD